MIGTTHTGNVRIKDEPTEKETDNCGQSKAAESLSDATIVTIGQSDTEPPTPPPPTAAAVVAHEEQDTEMTDNDNVEKETDTESQSVPQRGC